MLGVFVLRFYRHSRQKCWFFRYYVALAQRFNRLKTLKSLLKFSLNRDFYYGTKVTQVRVS